MKKNSSNHKADFLSKIVFKLFGFLLVFSFIFSFPALLVAQRTQKPVLHGKQWMAITGKPLAATAGAMIFLAFAVQGGDSQDQNLLQFFLNIVEFGMNVQEAVEAPNINSFQMRSSFGAHETRPGRILLADSVPPWTRNELRKMGYDMTFEERTSGPINAIFFDRAHGSLWRGSSNQARITELRGSSYVFQICRKNIPENNYGKYPCKGVKSLLFNSNSTFFRQI